MHGRPKLHNRVLALGVLFLFSLLFLQNLAAARELRRSMGFLRPYLMGDAYVAVADEASTLFYNPAGIRGLPASSTELLTPQLYGDRRVKLALLDPEALKNEFKGLGQEDFGSLLGTSLFFGLNLRAPVIVMPEQGIAYGLGAEVSGYLEILRNPVLPGMRLEFATDQILFISKSFQVTDNFSMGFTPKMIQRYGIDAVFTLGELFAAGSSLSLDNHPAFQDAANGVIHQATGMDVGFLYRFPFLPQWQPRVGYSMLNIGSGKPPSGILAGMEFGERGGPYKVPVAGELPQFNTIGFAVSPVVDFIRYTIAVDYVDVTRKALPGKDHANRTRIGFEMGFGPREDGTAILSLLAGLNATHPSAGVISRVGFWELGFGYYEVERGSKPGYFPDQRYILIFGFRL